MATENTKLLGKTFNYRTSVPLEFTASEKSNDCTVAIPSTSNTDCDTKQNGLLTLDELLPYQNDPWWERIRLGVMISFILLFIAILIASCIISFTEDKQHCVIKKSNMIRLIGDGGVMETKAS